MAYRDDVADIAYAAAIAHMRQGKSSVTIRGVTFDLVTKGYCARFCRQCFECAQALQPFYWPYAAPNARRMEEWLKGAGKKAISLSPGSIVAMNGTTHSAGHIGIYLGTLPGFDGVQIAHNTSGYNGPGTVITALSRVQGIVSGYYNTLPARPATAPEGPVDVEGKVVVLPGDQHWVEAREITPGHVWVPLVAFLDAAHAQDLAHDLQMLNNLWVERRRIYTGSPPAIP